MPVHMMVAMTGWRLEHTYAELPRSSTRRPRRRRSGAAAGGLQPAAGGGVGVRCGRARRAPRRGHLRRQRAAGGRRRSRRPMRAISTATSPPSATAARSCSASKSRRHGERFDIQLKGPGPTPYSRRGDGRAALGPMLREYIISEAMHALGIPTTRSLAVAATGEPVYRETALPGAVLTRVAASHIRVGTFEWAAAHGDVDALRALADYTLRAITRSSPDAPSSPTLALLEAIIERQARADRALAAGRLHARRHEHRQHGALRRNHRLRPVRLHGCLRSGHGIQLHRHAAAVTPTATSRRSRTGIWPGSPKPCCRSSTRGRTRHRAGQRGARIVSRSSSSSHWLDGMRAKLGLFTGEDERRGAGRRAARLDAGATADFTNTFVALTAGTVPARSRDDADAECSAGTALAGTPRAPAAVARRGPRPDAARHNPAFIPRNHIIEEAIQAATGGDLSAMERLLGVLARPYDHQRDLPMFRAADPAERPYRAVLRDLSVPNRRQDRFRELHPLPQGTGHVTTMQKPTPTRREFIQATAAAAAAFTIVPRHVLGGQRFVAPATR